ncbi:hypothetical protein K1719_006085 [Acacia pycnantha]|nr:hypothetical protein K1719_006085 [Acacia pycnantha]
MKVSLGMLFSGDKFAPLSTCPTSSIYTKTTWTLSVEATPPLETIAGAGRGDRRLNRRDGPRKERIVSSPVDLLAGDSSC